MADFASGESWATSLARESNEHCSGGGESSVSPGSGFSGMGIIHCTLLILSAESDMLWPALCNHRRYEAYLTKKPGYKRSEVLSWPHLPCLVQQLAGASFMVGDK